MDYYKDIDRALEKAGVPYYHGMPVFSARDEPQSYISYTLHEKPYFYASGENMARQVWAAVSVFSPSVDMALYESVISAMKTAGFIWQDSADAGEITPYPCKKHYVNQEKQSESL